MLMLMMLMAMASNGHEGFTHVEEGQGKKTINLEAATGGEAEGGRSDVARRGWRRRRGRRRRQRVEPATTLLLLMPVGSAAATLWRRWRRHRATLPPLPPSHAALGEEAVGAGRADQGGEGAAAGKGRGGQSGGRHRLCRRWWVGLPHRVGAEIAWRRRRLRGWLNPATIDDADDGGNRTRLETAVVVAGQSTAAMGGMQTEGGSSGASLLHVVVDAGPAAS
uniref:DUF834 domain-containing protein n=1 Tax=Oryza meridionalis TaxID=40149 RepID=A0A0E0FEA8_9ORYZ